MTEPPAFRAATREEIAATYDDEAAAAGPSPEAPEAWAIAPQARVTREWSPAISYTAHGWFAEVWVTGALSPYWRSACLTQWGAKWAARRMARRLRRHDATGKLGSRRIV